MAIGRFNLSLTGVQPGGLVYVGGSTFSAASTVSLDNVFSSSYDNYKLVCSWDAPNSTRVYLRLRVSGTDNTSSNYNWARLNMSSGSATPSVGSAGSNGLTTTGFYMGNAENNGENSFSSDIFNPFTSKKTTYVSTAQATESATNSTLHYFAGGMSVTTSYTGFTLSPSAAPNITGTIKVYGYRNDNN